MKQYGRSDKKAPLASGFSFGAESRKELITDYFTINKENFVKKTAFNTSTQQHKHPKQTFLDLGQKNLVFTECSECGMKYDSSFEKEVQLHKRFHRLHASRKSIKFNTKDIIGRYGDFIAIIVPSSRCKELMDLVNSEMNAVSLAGNECVYAAVEGENRLCSVAITEPDPILLKLSRIWTRQDMRRKGLATFLLDSVIKFEGKLKENVQFSSPTPLGNLFARTFTGMEFFSTYNI
jgi:hypothetical protein